MGCQSKLLRRKILERGEDSLDDVLKKARIIETVVEQQKMFDGNTKEKVQQDQSEVCKIETKTKYKRPNTFNNQNSGIECSRCGYKSHKASDKSCPAIGKTCNKCSGKNHFARKCMTRNNKRKFDDTKEHPSTLAYKKPNAGNEPVQSIEQSHNVNECDDYDDIFYFESGGADNQIWCKVGGIDIKVVIDSGSKHNIVDRDTWIDLKNRGVRTISRQKEIDRNFNAYGGFRLKLLGMFEAMIETPTKSLKATFYVVDEFGKFLVGFYTGRALNVLKVGYSVNSIRATPSQEFNKFKGILGEIPTRADVKPVSQPYRRVPVPLEQKVDGMVQDFLDQGVIEKVNGPSKWISPLVVVPKSSGDLRICVDMRRVNEAVDRENHQPTTVGKCFNIFEVGRQTGIPPGWCWKVKKKRRRKRKTDSFRL